MDYSVRFRSFIVFKTYLFGCSDTWSTLATETCCLCGHFYSQWDLMFCHLKLNVGGALAVRSCASQTWDADLPSTFAFLSGRQYRLGRVLILTFHFRGSKPMKHMVMHFSRETFFFFPTQRPDKASKQAGLFIVNLGQQLGLSSLSHLLVMVDPFKARDSRRRQQFQFLASCKSKEFILQLSHHSNKRVKETPRKTQT